MAETNQDILAGIIAAAVAKAIADSKDELTAIAKEGGDAAAGGFLGDVGRLTDIVSSLLGDIPFVADLLGIGVDPIQVIENAGGRMGRGFGFGYLFGYLGWQLMNPLLLPVIHEVNAHTTNVLYDPDTAAQLVSKGVIQQDQGRSESSGGGLDNPHFDGLVDAQYVRPALAELLELLRRGEIKQQDFALALQRNGIPDFWWDPLQALGRVLLSPADLADATLRGFLDPDVAQEYAGTLGVLAPDFQVLIDNTGEPPGLMQLLEAYRREFIDEDRLKHGIRESRVRDEWIDVVEALRFEPMSAADSVNAAVQGHLSYDDAKTRATRAGLLPDDFDVVYQNAGEPIGLVEMLELLNRGVMTQDQVIQGIKESHYKDKYIPFILERKRTLIPYRTINTIIEKGVRDKQWGISYLMDLGYTQDDADALVSTSTSTKSAKAKELTEAQTLELYKAKQVKRDDALQMLETLGYDAHDADFLLSITDAQQSQAEQGKAIAAIRSSFLASKIVEQDASNQLDQLHVLSEARDQLLADWKIEKAGQVKTLTAAQVAAAVYYGIWSYDQAVAKLVELGYSQNDAAVVVDLRVHGVPSTEAPPGPPTRVGT